MSSDPSIIQFTQLGPHQFPYVIKHDWWQHHPLEEFEIRSDLEVWLSRSATDEDGEMLKIRCSRAHYTGQGIVFPRFERPLHLGVKSIRDRQWEGYRYAFIDQETGMELFECEFFTAWIAPPVNEE